MTVETPHTQQANGTQATGNTALRDSLLARVDGRVDERFDGETTRSSLAILLAGLAAQMALDAAITLVFVAGDAPGGATEPAAGTAAVARAASVPAADISAAAGKGID